MNRRLFGAFGVLAVAAFPVGGCKTDPFSDLDGTPSNVVTSFSYLQLPIGGQATVNASVVDGRATPLEVPITFTPCTADVTVATDTSYHPVPVTSAQAIVTAVSLASSCVVASGGGLQDTIQVTTMPVAFNGGISTTDPIIGDTLTLTSSATLSFTDTANIDFGDGIQGEILVRNADTLMVRVPQPEATQPATLSITGVRLDYATGLAVTIATPSPMNVQPVGDRTAPGNVVITLPADGGADLEVWDGFKAGANGTGAAVIDYFYTFTVAAADTITFTIDWDGAADLDMYVCNAACSAFIGGFGAATGANPETFTVTFSAAGTYHLLIESWDDHDEPARLFRATVRNP